MKDYYKILGVSRTASDEEIKKAYKKMSMKYHPDRPAGDEEKFKDINKAYEILSDPLKRVQYNQGQQNPTGGNGDYEHPSDASGSNTRFRFNTNGNMPNGFNFSRFTTTNHPFSGASFFSTGNDFDDMFDNDSDFKFPFDQNKRNRVDEQSHVLKLSLEEMYKGGEHNIQYPKNVIVDGENVKISWELPFNGGSTITGYVIKIR